MQARRRTDIFATIVLVLAPAAPTAQSTQPSPAPSPTPSLFDPRRPPARELETRVPDGFTLAAVGDLITTHPLAQTLPSDPDFRRRRQGPPGRRHGVRQLRDDGDRPRPLRGAVVSRPRRLAARRATRGRPGPARARLRFGFAGQQPRDGLRDRGHAGDQPLARRRRHRLRRDRREPRRGPGCALSRRGPRRASVSSRWPRRTGTMPTPCRRRAARAGRPGINALRTTKTYVVTPETLRQLRAVKEALEAPEPVL